MVIFYYKRTHRFEYNDFFKRRKRHRKKVLTIQKKSQVPSLLSTVYSLTEIENEFGRKKRNRQQKSKSGFEKEKRNQRERDKTKAKRGAPQISCQIKTPVSKQKR